MNLNNFIQGLQILRSHFEDQTGYHLGAEHDQFYVYATDTPLSNDEFDRMKFLGWFQTEHGEDSYSPNDGWTCFV